MAEQIMIAKLNAMVPQGKGLSRLRVIKGHTTAEQGAEIVRTSPHLWQPLKVDFRAERGPGPENDDVTAAYAASGVVYLDQVRRLCAAMVQGGVDVPGVTVDTTDEELARKIVDAALTHMGLNLDPFAEADEDDDDDAGQDAETPDGPPVDDEPAGLTPLPGQDQHAGDVTPPAGDPQEGDMGDDGIAVNTGDDRTGDGPLPLDEDEARAAADAGTPGDAVNVGASKGEQGPQPPEAEEFDDEDPAATKEGRDRIRAWARDNNVDVSDHGKIPDSVVDQYREANAGNRVNR